MMVMRCHYVSLVARQSVHSLIVVVNAVIRVLRHVKHPLSVIVLLSYVRQVPVVFRVHLNTHHNVYPINMDKQAVHASVI